MKNGRENIKNHPFNNNRSNNSNFTDINCSKLSLEVSNKGGYKMRGISLPFDFLYIIIFFLAVAIVIIGIFVLISSNLKKGVESGTIWQWIENMLRKGMKG